MCPFDTKLYCSILPVHYSILPVHYSTLLVHYSILPVYYQYTTSILQYSYLDQGHNVAEVQVSALGLQEVPHKWRQQDVALSSVITTQLTPDVIIHQKMKDQRVHELQQENAML